ncbi:MAG: methyltransferase domain-containing protein [Microthrixaceae bacterium]
MLWLDSFGPEPGRVEIEVAPIGLLKQRCTQRGDHYASLDLRPGAAEICGDLCLAPLRDRAVDLLVCFHVLEHVPEDHTAMAEIERVLSDEGLAILSVPWNTDLQQTFEDPDADPADFERLYGQRDHVRMYGRDFSERLRSAGLAVEEQIWTDLFTTGQIAVHALAGSDDRFWICRRDPK